MKVDPGIWRKLASKPNSTEYYEMILVYVDDVLHVSHDVEPEMEYKSILQT